MSLLAVAVRTIAVQKLVREPPNSLCSFFVSQRRFPLYSQTVFCAVSSYHRTDHRCTTNRCSDIGESFRQHALVRAPPLIGCTCEEMTISSVRGRNRQPKNQHEQRIFVYPCQSHGLQQLQLEGPSPPCRPDANKKCRN